MKSKGVWLILVLLLTVGRGAAEIESLSHVFLLGKGLKDLDGDHLADKITFSIVIPDRASAAEIAVAGDIAARANLESLAQDLALVTAEAAASARTSNDSVVLVGSSLTLIQNLKNRAALPFPWPSARQGLVYLLGPADRGDVAVIAGSDEALLKTGRAFFLRWPYLWEIWGRENGITYFSVEKDLARFLEGEKVPAAGVLIRAAFYDFPVLSPSQDSLKRLKYDSGEVSDLWVEVQCSGQADRAGTLAALEALKSDHRGGLRTDVLSYPGCGQVTFFLKDDRGEDRLVLPRVGYPKRMLTPGYKDAPKKNIREKDYDLLSLYSAKGLYSDSDGNGILDSLDSVVVLPEKWNLPALAPLASRLVLASAGASFPVFQLEDEVEDIKALTSPVLAGDNRFSRELARTGKLKFPELDSGWGVAQVVPKAFNKSNALAISGADDQGLAKVLEYLSRTFPYFAEYKEGTPQLSDVAADLDKFLKGDKGSAEAFLQKNISQAVDEVKDKDLTSFSAEIYLPERNPKFTAALEAELRKSLKTAAVEVKNYALKENKVVFQKEKDFPWEADEALALLEEKIKDLKATPVPLKISFGLSESPPVREEVESRAREVLRRHGFTNFDIEVLCAYKQGFFWLTEKVAALLEGKPVSSLVIRFAERKEDFASPKRFYEEPVRWLQELYPADEILAARLGLPLEKIDFQAKSERSPVYEVTALNSSGRVILQESFSPRTREIPYLSVLPEWGRVKVATGWLVIKEGEHVVLDASIQTDLERFWDYFQGEVLTPVYTYIMKKTANDPSTTKQPYFKRLLVELWLSEPDYKLGLEEEIVSSLEAIHDEVYFDSLDFLRGITRLEIEDADLPEDTSRLSAPGNIFPLIHPSSEGLKGRVRVVFEDWQAPSPQAILKWKEKGREEEFTRKLTFPVLKASSVRFPSLVYNGKVNRVENLTADLEFEKEADYLSLLDIVQTYETLAKEGILAPSFSYPRLHSLNLRLKYKDLEKDEVIAVAPDRTGGAGDFWEEGKALPVTTREIISPEMCLEIVRGLSRRPLVKAYIGGHSYENRNVPVLELFTPQGRYVSLARLVTFKPTLFLSGRQHANEVSSTNYILKFAELLASDENYQDFVKKMNFALEPMENPDGAALAYELQKLTPFHSLHAGRYSSLGLDIGYQVRSASPLLPEAAVRRKLDERWFPDIYLNLHGYPSHEWVQAFSGYSPYLFREYWIPKGWFAYYDALRLPVYEPWKKAGDELRKTVVEEMDNDPAIRESNDKMYNRFWRWAARWQPHLDYLELHDGVDLYAERRSPRENKLTPRKRTTFVEETPEVMDETARGAWLEFLCREGLTYLRAHVRYLSQAAYEISRIEEEVQGRIRIEFSRRRPGKLASGEPER